MKTEYLQFILPLAKSIMDQGMMGYLVNKKGHVTWSMDIEKKKGEPVFDVWDFVMTQDDEQFNMEYKILKTGKTVFKHVSIENRLLEALEKDPNVKKAFQDFKKFQKILNQPERQKIPDLIQKLKDQGFNSTEIKDRLNRDVVLTATGKRWTKSNVKRYLFPAKKV